MRLLCPDIIYDLTMSLILPTLHCTLTITMCLPIITMYLLINTMCLLSGYKHAPLTLSIVCSGKQACLKGFR